MELKEFFKPTWKKVIILISIFILIFIILKILGQPQFSMKCESCPEGALCDCTSYIFFGWHFYNFYILAGIYIAILIISYILSCLISGLIHKK